MKTKDSKETVCAFLPMITKNKRPKKNLADKRLICARVFEKLCEAKGIQTCSTMSDTKAAFAEGRILSPKIKLYRYIEDNIYKCIHKLTQFVKTPNSRRNYSIDLLSKKVKTIPPFCPFCAANRGYILENTNLKLKTEFASLSVT